MTLDELKRLAQATIDAGVVSDAPGIATIPTLITALEEALAFHHPQTDGPFSLVTWEYCSCGAMERFYDTEEQCSSVGPARYPCAEVRAIRAVLQAGGIDG